MVSGTRGLDKGTHTPPEGLHLGRGGRLG